MLREAWNDCTEARRSGSLRGPFKDTARSRPAALAIHIVSRSPSWLRGPHVYRPIPLSLLRMEEDYGVYAPQCYQLEAPSLTSRASNRMDLRVREEGRTRKG